MTIFVYLTILFYLSYLKMQQQKEAKRVRDGNWTPAEKACLRECIDSHINIIEDKSNEGAMIAKKREAWKEVKMTMLAAGFDRDASKLRQQWARMKLAVKKSFRAERHAASATGNVIEVPTIDSEDILIQSMIAPELEEDTILIDSDTHFLDEQHSNVIQIDSDEMPILSDEADVENVPPPQPRTHIERLRNVPPYKRNVIEERQRQIQTESSNSNEIHLLQSELLRAQLKHQREVEKYKKELHLLKVELLRQQIANEKLKSGQF